MARGHTHDLSCIQDRGGRLYCKSEAERTGGSGILRMTPAAKRIGMLIGERRQREGAALRLVRAKSDLLPGSQPKFEWWNGSIDHVTVNYTLFDGRPASDRVKWDDRGAYLVGSMLIRVMHHD